MTKTEAGRLGGLATVRKYGADYMRVIGRAGGRAFVRNYYISGPRGSYGSRLLVPVLYRRVIALDNSGGVPVSKSRKGE